MKAKVNGEWLPVKKYKCKNSNNEWAQVPNIKVKFGDDGWHETVPPNAIILYDLPEGSLPSTATLCDGTNDNSLNLIDRFVMLTTDHSKILEIGGSEGHHGTEHGDAGFDTDTATPSVANIYMGSVNASHTVSCWTNSAQRTHKHTTLIHSHSGFEYHNGRKRKLLQPTMFDDVIRNGAVFLNLYGIMGKLESIIYEGFLVLSNTNTAYLTDSDNTIYNHTHDTALVDSFSGVYSWTTNKSFKSINGGKRITNPHYHSLTHKAASSGEITFPNQNFYTGKVNGNLYWDELPYGTVCFFISDLLPTGWQPLIEIKKYSNGLVTSTVNTESLIAYLDSNINSDTTANPRHSHLGSYKTGDSSFDFGMAKSNYVKNGYFAGIHTHTVQDNHSIEVDHTPPYIKLFVGYKVLPTYTVTFDANGGEGEQEALTKTYQIALTMPTCTFTKTGYVLKNWNTRADGNGTAYTEGSSTFNLNEDITLYAIWEETSYDIAPGTYTPSVFKNLIAEKVSLNGSRTVSKSFTATVNGQTITVPVGAIIYYRTTYSGGIYIVGFGTYTDNTAAGGASSSSGFTNYKTYIVDVTSGHGAVVSYSIYSITIGGGGIKFN